MKVSLIVAVAEDDVIGKDNRLIWNLPADMKFFRDTTIGHCIITGRKNYESIPDKFRPLPGRTNVVVTRQHDYNAPGATVVHSLEDALKVCRSVNDDEIFIIGGAQIFKEALEKKLVDTMYITRIKKEYDGDVFFPSFDESNWNKIILRLYQADEKNEAELEFIRYDKK